MYRRMDDRNDVDWLAAKLKTRPKTRIISLLIKLKKIRTVDAQTNVLGFGATGLCLNDDAFDRFPKLSLNINGSNYVSVCRI